MKLNLASQQLTCFDASKGEVRTTLVETLDLSRNKLTTALHLTRLTALTALDISRNELTVLCALPPRIRRIDASWNRLESCDALAACGCVEQACISHNVIASLPILPSSLKVLDVSNNALQEVAGLPEGLWSLDLSHNNIRDFSRLPRSLRILDTRGNAEATLDTELVFHWFHRLTQLDGVPLSQSRPRISRGTSTSSTVASSHPSRRDNATYQTILMPHEERSLTARVATLMQRIAAEDKRHASLRRDQRMIAESVSRLADTEAELTRESEALLRQLDYYKLSAADLRAARAQAKADFEAEHAQAQRSRIAASAVLTVNH